MCFRVKGAPEHYVDLPRSANGIEVAHPCPVTDRCVISAILNDTRDLALSLDVSDQLRLLKSLGHAVWDTCIIEKKIGLDYADIAVKLHAEITDEDRARWIPPIIDVAAVVRWANESLAIAERPDVQYCVQVAERREWLWLMTRISQRKPQRFGSGSRRPV